MAAAAADDDALAAAKATATALLREVADGSRFAAPEAAAVADDGDDATAGTSAAGVGSSATQIRVAVQGCAHGELDAIYATCVSRRRRWCRGLCIRC